MTIWKLSHKRRPFTKVSKLTTLAKISPENPSFAIIVVFAIMVMSRRPCL